MTVTTGAIRDARDVRGKAHIFYTYSGWGDEEWSNCEYGERLLAREARQVKGARLEVKRVPVGSYDPFDACKRCAAELEEV